MPVDERYRRQVELLVRTLPHVSQERCFALKGGTAINLFVRNLPRLSVDIDLPYLPVADRARSLADIEAALRRIGKRIEGVLPVARVQTGVLREEGTVNKLFVRERGTQIKVEVTPVLRGCVFEPEERTVSDAVEEQFGFAAIQVVSFPALFAGKVVAALDRQHPRDLFDIHDLLSNEGVDDGIRAAFIVYLVSHHRPIERLLAPVRRDMREEFERGLAGMMEVPVALDVLVRAREELVAEIVGRMPDAHREFLRSIAGGEPQWSLLEVSNVSSLPAVVWRMRKLAQLDEKERSAMIKRIEAALRDHPPLSRIAPDRGSEGSATLAFFEAYFSNFIKGTEFAVAEAADIVFRGAVPNDRPADAHDILGTWRIVSDTRGMGRTPTDAGTLEALLTARHALVMEGRPERQPGAFKQTANQTGLTVFVAPDLVTGTLAQGFDLYRSLETPFHRAVFMMFLIAEVHPFVDGNGRIARIMMNAELVAASEERIIVPTVYRANYLSALKALSQTRRAEPLIRMLDYAQRWTAAVDWRSLVEARRELEECNAFVDPNIAEVEGRRLRMPGHASA